MSVLRAGIVGCGAIAPKHVEAIRATPGLELVAACDIIPERAEALGVWAFTNYRAMLDRASLDLVSVCTPNYLHWDMATAVVRAGADVVVEKPVSLCVPDVREQSLARHIFPVLQVRENRAVKALMTAIPHLGRIYSCALEQRWKRDGAYYTSATWRASIGKSGGSLFTQGIHYVDVMLQALGPVREVSARMATLNHAVEVEDELAACFEFESGAIGTYSFSLNTEDENMTRLEVNGANGTIGLDGGALNSVAWWDVKGVPYPDISPEAANAYGGAYQGSPANHTAIYRQAADHILCGVPITHTLESALPAIDFIVKAYQGRA
ncbi:MAG: Gfo/Idh/MocA family oxidoreductase [Parcubacteria group bacterium]|nr:Gfo/Idh/MocA family oxidoreductase [Methanoregula sp.]